MPVSSINSFADAAIRFCALSLYTVSEQPKIEKVCREASTTSIAVSSLHANSMTKRDLCSCMTKILVADVNKQGLPIVRKSQCHRPKRGASVIIVLYMA